MEGAESRERTSSAGSRELNYALLHYLEKLRLVLVEIYTGSPRGVVPTVCIVMLLNYLNERVQ